MKKNDRLSKSWNEMLKQHSKPLERGAVAKGVYVKDNGFKTTIQPYRRGSNSQYKSLETPGYTAVANTPKVYTGDKIVGIGILHKSCIQPIFSKEQCEDISKMRR